MGEGDELRANAERCERRHGIDLLNVNRDRLLHQHLRSCVLGVGIPHPEVLPALLVDPGDPADDEAGGVRAGGELEGDLPVLLPALRTRGPEEQHFSGSKPLEPVAVDGGGQEEQRRLVGTRHVGRSDVVRLGEVVNRDIDVDAFDVILRHPDRPAEVGSGLAGSCVAGTVPASLRDVLRAAAGVERERRLTGLGRAGGPLTHRPFPDLLADPLDVSRLPNQPAIERW